MAGIVFDTIPSVLTARPQWCMWKIEMRKDRMGKDKPQKVPFQVNGVKAESNNPATWTDFATVRKCYERGGYEGIGYVFSANDPFCGIDLDSCRDNTTGLLDAWAKEAVLKLNSYTEVSPSGFGVKIIAEGKSPFTEGRNEKLPFGERNGKESGIEMYDHGRYFTITGWHLRGLRDIHSRQPEIEWLASKYIPEKTVLTPEWYGDDAVLERARAYVAKMPPAVSGSGGHNQTFRVACVLVKMFGLTRASALTLLREYNQLCQPPWSERELEHKVDDAHKQPGPNNALRNVTPEKWGSVTLPEWKPTKRRDEPTITLLTDAANNYIERVSSGGVKLIKTGIRELDSAIGGGFEAGELVVVAARPSHGKSAFGLQCLHYWTQSGMPAVMLSEEMSAIALGKRALQFITDEPVEHWDKSIATIRQHLAEYRENNEKCLIVENCRTVEMAVEQIERAVTDHGAKVAVVDYAQLLRGEGKGRYEQITNVSNAIRAVTNKHKILTVMLCQLNREVEKRKQFVPMLSDIRDSGSIEQDADVILFLVWRCKILASAGPREYEIHVSKVRNRGIEKSKVLCEFLASRQMLVSEKPENYTDEFTAYGGDF